MSNPPEDQVEFTVGADRFLAHALTPSNLGVLPNPDGYANVAGTCGDRMEIYLRLEDQIIADIRFLPEGCMHTVACGSAITSLVRGRSLAEASDIRASAVDEQLGGLDREHRHCAALAEAALKAAIRDALKKRAEPAWKRAYRGNS